MKKTPFSEAGVSLIELVVGAAMVTVVVISLSLFFTKSTRSLVSSQYRAVAKNLAKSTIQQQTQMSYYFLPVTPAIAGNFPVSGISAYPTSGCDCSRENLSATTIPSIPSIMNNVTYNSWTCVNLVVRPTGGNWTSYCSDGTPNTDTGLKMIHVQVSWNLGPTSQTVDMIGLVNRR